MSYQYFCVTSCNNNAVFVGFSLITLGSSPVAVTSILDIAPVSSKEFLDILANIESAFTLKRVRDMIRTYSCSFFTSHLNYGCQPLGHSSTETQRKRNNIQNRALQTLTFRKKNETAENLYKTFNILKFRNLVTLQNCLFIYKLEQDKLSKSLPGLTYIKKT